MVQAAQRRTCIGPAITRFDMQRFFDIANADVPTSKLTGCLKFGTTYEPNRA
jgi:hypothetical protein